MIMIILVGPQGAGKTTLANIIRKRLSKDHKVCVVKLIDYTILHHTYLKILRIMTEKPSNETIFARLAPIYVFLHLAGFVISRIKFAIYSLTKKCYVIVEDEGYIFKELTDFYFIMGVTGALRNKFVKYSARNFLRFLFRVAFKKMYHYIIVYVDAPYEILLQRYIKTRRYIEPEAYINFQRFLYNILLQHVVAYHKDFCRYIYIRSMNVKSLLSVADFIINVLRMA